jgi:hypothetical protein
MHQDSLALCPTKSNIPTTDTTLEHTGAILDFPILTKEGNINMMPTDTPPAPATTAANNDDDDESFPDLLNPDDDSSVSTSGSDSDCDEKIDDDEDILNIESGAVDITNADITSPQPLSAPPRWSTRIKKPNSKYAFHTCHYNQADNATENDFDLVFACASKAVTCLPTKDDALSWEPATHSIQDILKMPEGPRQQACLKSVWKELKALVDAKTFAKSKRKDLNSNTCIWKTILSSFIDGIFFKISNHEREWVSISILFNGQRNQIFYL